MSKHNNIEIIWLGQPQFESLLYKKTIKALGYEVMGLMDSYNNDEIEEWKAFLLRQKELDYSIFDNYNAIIHPAQTSFYRDLMHHYPNAKFILEDMSGQTWQRRHTRLKTVMKLFFWLRLFKKSRNLLTLIDLITHLHTRGAKDKLSLQKRWEDFTIQVTKEIPAHRLLLFNRNSGWKQLCDFLEKPIPDVPLPLNNDNQTIKRTIQHITMTGLRKNQLFVLLYFTVLVSIFVYLIFFY